MKTLLTSPNSLNLSACMMKYMYDKIVEAAPERRADYLDKGDMMHVMLAEYYKQKMLPVEERPPHIEMIENAIERGRHRVISLDLELEVSEEEVIPTFREYCEYYAADNWIPIAVEQEVVWVLHEVPDRGFCKKCDKLVDIQEKNCIECNEAVEVTEEGIRILMQMIVDIIFENQQGHRLWTDHKTRSRNSDPMPLSNQFIAYAVASGTKRAVRNNIGFQKTLPAEKKFTRDFFPYPQGVLDWWREWTIYRAQFIDACVKTENFPPDFTTCDKYSGCIYADVCMQSPNQRERFLQDNFVKRRRIRSIYDRSA